MHDLHDEQTGSKKYERTGTRRNGITTKKIRHDTIGALRPGYHYAYRAHCERTDNEARGTKSKANLRANETHTDRRIREQR